MKIITYTLFSFFKFVCNILVIKRRNFIKICKLINATFEWIRHIYMKLNYIKQRSITNQAKSKLQLHIVIHKTQNMPQWVEKQWWSSILSTKQWFANKSTTLFAEAILPLIVEGDNYFLFLNDNIGKEGKSRK